MPVRKWLCRKGIVGKIVAVPVGLLWWLVGLTIIAAIVGPIPRERSGKAAAAGVHPGSDASGYVRLGSWDVALTDWHTTNRGASDLDGNQFTWLVTRWKIHNPTSNALQLLPSLDFSATSFDVEKLGAGDFVPFALHVRSFPSGYILPGQTVRGDVALQVFRRASTVKVRFYPSYGNDNDEAETYTIAP